jgi:hypothetical protein
MASCPGGSVLVEILAVPEAFRGNVPSVVPPKRNVTVPVGVTPAMVGLTVAERVTLLPKAAGLREDVKVMSVVPSNAIGPDTLAL